jgi:hypothetical protein
MSTIGPPFQGTFSAWFADGGRFVTGIGNTVLIYSKASIQEEAAVLSGSIGAGGLGNWFWTGNANGTAMNLYAVGGGTTPVATYPTSHGVIQSGTTLGLVGTNSVSVIDLAGGTPVKTDIAVPITGNTTYAASSGAQWLIGNQFGVILDGANLPTTARYLGYGQAWSIAGSASLFAVATASGQILYFDAASLTRQGTIQDFSSKLQLSTDGTVLAAQGNNLQAQYNPDWSLNVYSLPSQTLLAHWPYMFVGLPPPPLPADIALSGSGTVLGQVLVSNGTDTRKVTGITPASNVIWADTVGELSSKFDPIRLSPDGTLIAAATGPYDVSGSGTNILKNGALVTAVTGWPLGWLDDGHLIVNTYAPPTVPPMLGSPPYTGASVLDAMGNKLASSAIPELHEFQPLTADTIYSAEINSILTVSTGATAWSSGQASRGKGAVAGGYVIFASGARVLALPH